MPSTEAKVMGCGCVTIASCIMLALSFSILSPQQYGIHYNAVRRTLEHDVYSNGRWFLGLGHEFIKYPRQFQYIEYSNAEDGGEENTPITCWSKDGQEIILEVGLYYYYMREKLVDTYYKFRTNVEPVIEKVSRHAIRDTCVKFNTIQFFEDRVNIQAAFKAVVNKRLIAQTHVAVPLFNLMSIDVPSLFESAVNAKIITKQRERTLQYKRYTEVTRAKIGVLIANAQKNITLIKAAAQFNARVTVADAEAAVLREVLPMESKMHKVVMDTLFANADLDLPLVTADTTSLHSGTGTIDITQTTAGSNSTAEVQSAVCTGTSGTFTLSYRGHVTTALAFDASQPVVQAAFRSLPSVNSSATVGFSSGVSACTSGGTNSMTLTFADNADNAKINLLHYVWATMLREKVDKTEFMVGFNGGTNIALQA